MPHSPQTRKQQPQIPSVQYKTRQASLMKWRSHSEFEQYHVMERSIELVPVKFDFCCALMMLNKKDKTHQGVKFNQ